MATTKGLVIGNQLFFGNTAGVASKSVVWTDAILSSPKLSDKLNEAVNALVKGEQFGDKTTTIIISNDDDLNVGYFKTALSIRNGYFSFHGYWYPAKSPTILAKLARGEQAWHKGGNAPEEWLWSGGTCTFYGLEDFARFLEAVAPLLFMQVGGSRAIGRIAHSLYCTFAQSILGNPELTLEKNYRVPRTSDEIDKLEQKFLEFAHVMRADSAPLPDLDIAEALSSATTFLDRLVIKKITEGEIPAVMGPALKMQLSSGAYILYNIFRMYMLLGQIENELERKKEDYEAAQKALEAEEDEILVVGLKMAEQEVQDLSQNKGGYQSTEEARAQLRRLADDDTANESPSKKQKPEEKKCGE